MIAWTCRSNQKFIRFIKSYTNKNITYTIQIECSPEEGNHLTCDCPSFVFRNTRNKSTECKHIIDVKKQLCGWNKQLDPGLVPSEGDMIVQCPKCGGPVVPVRTEKDND